MTRLATEVDLSWHTRLCQGGGVVVELCRPYGTRERWAWIVNAGTSGWTAHLGSWDGKVLRTEYGVVREVLKHHELLADAQAWCMEQLAAAWAEGRPGGWTRPADTVQP